MVIVALVAVVMLWWLLCLDAVLHQLLMEHLLLTLLHFVVAVARVVVVVALVVVVVALVVVAVALVVVVVVARVVVVVALVVVVVVVVGSFQLFDHSYLLLLLLFGWSFQFSVGCWYGLLFA